jgi:hypothetical protein
MWRAGCKMKRRDGDWGRSYSDLYAVLQNAENLLRRKVSPTFLSPKDWQRKASEKGSFISKIIALPKIFVFGSEKDFGYLTEKCCGTDAICPPVCDPAPAAVTRGGRASTKSA